MQKKIDVMLPVNISAIKYYWMCINAQRRIEKGLMSDKQIQKQLAFWLHFWLHPDSEEAEIWFNYDYIG